jgi:hypothetical protein
VGREEVRISLWAGKSSELTGMGLENLCLLRQKTNQRLDDLKFGE